MKTSYSLNRTLSILLMIFTVSVRSESKVSDLEDKNYAQLPSGVTQDWLSNALDENGNKLLPRQQKINETDDIQYNLAMTGEATNNSFGNSVSSAGDINDDGYKDVIVGAYGYGSGGRAYIFLGGSSMNNVADVIMTGEASGNSFGWAVSSAGDVNNDGYSDVIVGAPGYNSQTGRAYIFFGGPSMNNVADVIMNGEATTNSFGTSVSSAGDVNNDGYSDVIVGASSYSSSTGRAYIFFGGSSMDNVSDVTLTGEFTNNSFGTSVSSAGNVNGDAYSDVIVGAEGYSTSTGRAYIYFGGFSMDNVADVIMTGEVNNNSFGTSVSKAGNVNGDGYDDVIVAADGYSSSTGRAYIFLGGSSMNNIADVIMTGEGTSNFFGWSVSTTGDVNLDGYSDIIVGAPGYGSGTFTGRAYLFYGGAFMDNLSDGAETGEGLNNSFGRSVSSAGDLNYDGAPDIIIGASFYNSSTGRAYIYFANTPTTPASALKFDGVNDYVSLPNSLVSQATGITQAITIEYWFKGSYLQSAVRFQPAANDFIVAGWSGQHIISSDGGTSGISVGAGATDGNWHHVAMTWQKNTVNGFKSYLDGNLVDQRNSANANLPALSSGGFIGSYQGTQEFINGSLDEVRIWQRALTQSEIQAFRNCEFTGGRQGLIAYYKFNQGISGGINTGINLLIDYSGNFYTGTLNNFSLEGGTNSNWISPGGVTNGVSCGQLGSGLNFDGVNDHVQLLGGLGLAVSNAPAITIEYWYKGTNNQSAVRFQEFTTNFIVAGWSGRHIISTDGGTTGIAQGAAVTDGNWHHVAMTWQKNTVNGFRSFLDGQIVEQKNSANVNLPPFTNAYVPLLGSFDGTQEFMQGTLDNVRIWNRALSQLELQFRMHCETPSSATGLIANYHFNQGLADSNNASVTSLYDASGNSYNGQLYNFALTGNTSNWVTPSGVLSGISCFGGLFTITAVPEGFYNPSTNTSSKRDTLRVYLRNNSLPYDVVDSAKAVMDSVTLSQYFIFPLAGNGTYYLQLKHRNSLETWSKPGGVVYNTDILNNYDFTTSNTQAYGNNMKQVDTSPLRFAIYSGDVNVDGLINLPDIILIFNNASNFVNGYVSTDLNGDNITSLSDIIIANNNSVNFVSVNRPFQ